MELFGIAVDDNSFLGRLTLLQIFIAWLF